MVMEFFRSDETGLDRVVHPRSRTIDVATITATTPRHPTSYSRWRWWERSAVAIPMLATTTT